MTGARSIDERCNYRRFTACGIEEQCLDLLCGDDEETGRGISHSGKKQPAGYP